MSDDRAVLRKKMQDELAELKSSAIAELEHRGYEVRGKTTSQIREILKRHPTKTPSIAKIGRPAWRPLSFWPLLARGLVSVFKPLFPDLRAGVS
jgi:hypothetical protein